jgi:parallel beta-helix repeat protein
VIVSIIAVAIPLLSPSPVHAALTPHDPIYLNGNDNFTSANGVVGGSGTADDPYIIDGWNINASSADGIKISNTNAHFIIRNCYVYGGHGILFDNTINGIVDNNTVENSFVGIWLDGSRNNIVSNNIVKSRKVIWFNQDNELVLGNSNGIYLYESDNNLIENNIVEGNSKGITLDDYSDYNIILNDIVDSNDYGFYLDSSDNNLINNSTAKNNSWGIYLYQYSDNNFICHNNFINNTSQAYDLSFNLWDNGYPSGGNYWSDYTGKDADGDGIGDIMYSIPRDSKQDRYPLMELFGEAPSAPSGGSNWPLIAGIVVIVIIGIGLAVYVKRH